MKTSYSRSTTRAELCLYHTLSQRYTYLKFYACPQYFDSVWKSKQKKREFTSLYEPAHDFVMQAQQ